MEFAPNGHVVDTLTLRFVGEEEDGAELHELRAAHVAEVLTGLVGLASDFTKAGAFGDGLGSEVLVRPAQEGSFIIEVVRTALENPEATSVVVGGIPGLATVLLWATKSVRADVKDFEYLPNGNVKVVWQDDKAQEIPAPAWKELQKGKRRRNAQLRQIMAPLSDERVTELEVSAETPASSEETTEPQVFTLVKTDYDAARAEDEIEETTIVFEVEAQMSAIDFDNAGKWRVKTIDDQHTATVEDAEFLSRVSMGRAIRKSDIFELRVREDATKKNGRTRRKWTVLEVISHRRATHDDDEQRTLPPTA